MGPGLTRQSPHGPSAPRGLSWCWIVEASAHAHGGKPVRGREPDGPGGLISQEVGQSEPGYTDASTLNSSGLRPTNRPPAQRLSAKTEPPTQQHPTGHCASGAGSSRSGQSPLCPFHADCCPPVASAHRIAPVAVRVRPGHRAGQRVWPPRPGNSPTARLEGALVRQPRLPAAKAFPGGPSLL